MKKSEEIQKLHKIKNQLKTAYIIAIDNNVNSDIFLNKIIKIEKIILKIKREIRNDKN